jgi:hypothetical protein
LRSSANRAARQRSAADRLTAKRAIAEGDLARYVNCMSGKRKTAINGQLLRAAGEACQIPA